MVAALGSGGCSSDKDAPESSADKETKDRLQQAYTALEEAAQVAPAARLPRLKGEIEVIRKGETLKTSPAKNLGLLDYFYEREIALSLVLVDDQSEHDKALAGIEFTKATDSVDLIIPKELRYGSAPELLAAGAAFAAQSPTGEVYCIDDAEAGVKSCSAPAAPEK